MMFSSQQQSCYCKIKGLSTVAGNAFPNMTMSMMKNFRNLSLDSSNINMYVQISHNITLQNPATGQSINDLAFQQIENHVYKITIENEDFYVSKKDTWKRIPIDINGKNFLSAINTNNISQFISVDVQNFKTKYNANAETNGDTITMYIIIEAINNKINNAF